MACSSLLTAVNQPPCVTLVTVTEQQCQSESRSSKPTAIKTQRKEAEENVRTGEHGKEKETSERKAVVS